MKYILNSGNVKYSKCKKEREAKNLLLSLITNGLFKCFNLFTLYISLYFLIFGNSAFNLILI